MSLFRWLAASERRLAILSCVALGLVLGTAGPLSTWIRDQSDSIVSDLLILTGYVGLMLVAAVAVAIIISDRVFPHRWRDRVVLGLQVPSPDELDPMLPPVIPQSHLGAFSVLLVLLIVGLSGLLEVATNGLFAEYRRIGHMRTILRTDNTELKIELLREQAEAKRETHIEHALVVVDLAWRDKGQPQEVRRAALDSLGQLAHSLATSVDSWLRLGIKDHWELATLRRLRENTAPDLRARFSTEDPNLGVPMARTLGKLRDWRSTDTLVAYVTEHVSAPDEVSKACLAGLGMSRDARALGRLVALAEPLYEHDMFLELAYAIGELARHHEPEVNEEIDAVFPRLVEVFAKLATRPPFERQCQAVDVLRKTGDARIASPLYEIFEQEGAHQICATITVEVGEPAPEMVVATEPFRLRVIRALAMVAVGDAEIERWAEARVENESYTEFVRGQLREMLKLIEASR